ncbi:hypothetical protein [Halostreptopolyspora alba]|uniref:hypothetical protein n=1 Tax=Halostreptopolyspora alba TaxID=2487137 RepID=UPI0026982A9C
MAGYPPTPPPPGGPPGPPDPYGGRPGHGYPQQYPPAPQQGHPHQGYPQQPYGPPGGGPPPGYGGPVPPYQPHPPYPPQRPPRRTGAIVGGIAVGLVLLLGVGGVVAWVLLRPPAAYAALPGCDDLVTGEVTDIVGLRNAEVEEQVIEEEDFAEDIHRDVTEMADCGVFRDESAGYAGDEYLAIGISRYASDTVEDGYETVRDQVADKRSGNGLDERFDEVTSPEPIPIGDTGFQYIAEFNSENASYYGGDSGGSLSYVQFADRNMVVTLWYRAPDRTGNDEKRETSLEVAEEVVRTIPEVTDVED